MLAIRCACCDPGSRSYWENAWVWYRFLPDASWAQCIHCSSVDAWYLGTCNAWVRHRGCSTAIRLQVLRSVWSVKERHCVRQVAVAAYCRGWLAVCFAAGERRVAVKRQADLVAWHISAAAHCPSPADGLNVLNSEIRFRVLSSFQYGYPFVWFRWHFL